MILGGVVQVEAVAKTLVRIFISLNLYERISYVVALSRPVHLSVNSHKSNLSCVFDEASPLVNILPVSLSVTVLPLT